VGTSAATLDVVGRCKPMEKGGDIAMFKVKSATDSATGTNAVGQCPIAVPWVLGLYSLAGVTFVVATRMAGWYGGPESQLLVLPVAAVLGGVTQLLAGMWAFETADTLATAMLGTWGSFWIGYGVLNALSLRMLAEAPGPFHELGLWFAPLALITWMGAVAALGESVALVLTLTFLAAGSTIAAVANMGLHGSLVRLAGWLFIVSAALAWYTATAMLFEATSGRQIWPVGRAPRRNVAGPPAAMPAHEPPVRRIG
jgi:succinate-acetate transporter protein